MSLWLEGSQASECRRHASASAAFDLEKAEPISFVACKFTKLREASLSSHNLTPRVQRATTLSLYYAVMQFC